ncbi:DUF982 domain-containing protein [Xinfangfangia sp. D13-10-4-6]|uniref:DUF982 domain-containing protein n=1 Tax=Pseudogemmobacter hezensis TaxID=2737662 RepID=UPI001557101C|nr:DUF982 domain-containing protein [Pseudogemmobacter hezensis]NPD16266.1 DUF982 domain-containing protein [Pseudogemmobacter hezensis]
MIEIDWGKPLHFAVTEGDITKISSIEQAQYWLRKKWPVDDDARSLALSRIDAAIHCLASPGTAKRAFIAAIKSAGFKTEALVA